MKMRPWNVFGTKSRRGRLQDAAAGLPGNPFGAFWPKMVLQGALLEPSGVPKSIKNRTFGPRSAQGPSKNDVWEGD